MALSEINTIKTNLQLASFGGGCFWCTEVFFLRLDGVHSVVSGYCGGGIQNPTYDAICTGTTGHAEIIQISFNPDVISYTTLLEVFFHTHDPTTLNRQGNDIGTQYRSVIFPHTEDQKIIAVDCIQKINQAKVYPDPIVTTIEEFTVFYPAEKYHQNYYNRNENQGYCKFVIEPKLTKFNKIFSGLIIAK